MIKILSLGSEVESTGEVRVSLLDTSLVKMASNDIQRFWDDLKRDPSKAYLHVIAMAAIGWYNCNNNGDAFTEEDLRKYHPSFVADANIFMHHDNKDPAKSHGKVVYSFYNEPMHRVELVMALDKEKAPSVVAAIKRGDPIAVSMGVRVKFDKCSICGNEAKTRAEYCDHLRYNMKKILEDGRQVYALNPGPLKFFDISIVNKPADRTAWALQKAAQDKGYQEDTFKTSAELGEEYEDIQEKIAAITKFSEMLKEIDAEPIRLKDGDDKYRVHKALRDQAMQSEGPLDFDMPHVPFSELKQSGVSPGGLLSSIIASGAPLSLNEMAFAAGKHHLGDAFKEEHMGSLFSCMRPSLDILKKRPGLLQGLISDVINDTDQPEGVEISIKITPMAKQRRAMVIGMSAPGWEASQAKIASEVLRTLPVSQRHPVREYERPHGEGRIMGALKYMPRNMSSTGPSQTENFTVRGDDGSMYRTNRASVRAARGSEIVPDIVGGLASAGLSLAALGAAMSDNNLATKLISVPILAALAYEVHKCTSQPTIQTVEGMEVPSSTLFTRVKEASALSKMHLGPTIGAAAPAALALDYLYNKHIKHRQNPYYREGLDKGDKAADYLGEKTVSHPFSAIGGAAVGGGVVAALLNKGLLKR